MKYKLTLIALLVITLSCCSRPEGPAERLGRSIDDLGTNLQEISKDWDTNDAKSGTTVDSKNDENHSSSEKGQRSGRYTEAPDGLLDPVVK